MSTSATSSSFTSNEEVTNHVVLGAGAWPPVGTVASLLKSYPVVVIGKVDTILQPFDPRPGALGLSPDEIAALQSGPKGGPLPSDVLNRPPGSRSSIYSVEVIQSVLGDIPGSHFALMQPGGVFEDTAYEYDGDPVVMSGATYLFFLSEFDWRASGYQLPDAYEKFGDEYQTIYQSPAFGRFLIDDDGMLKAVDSRWSVGCPTCDALSLLNLTVQTAASLIVDASEGRPLPSPVSATNPPTAAPYTLTAIALDGDTSGNAAGSLGPQEKCRSIGIGDTATVDLTIRGVPKFDPTSYRGGIAGLGVTITFDPAILSITDVNPDGDVDSILTDDGEEIPLEVLDTDGTFGPPTAPLPAEKGYLRVDMADASQNYEDGDGILLRLVIKGAAAGETELGISQLAIYDASASPYEVASLSGVSVSVNGPCDY